MEKLESIKTLTNSDINNKNKSKNKKTKSGDDLAQDESNEEVMKMIKHIEKLYETSNPVLNNVDDIHLLYDALWDLYEIIGMPGIKKSIIKLIKFLMVDTTTNSNNKFDDHMLHTVVYGPPGVGKTMVGSVLAKIWGALGLLKKSATYTKSSKTNASLFSGKDSETNDITQEIMKLALLASTLKKLNDTTPQIDDKTENIERPKTPPVLSSQLAITNTKKPPFVYPKSYAYVNKPATYTRPSYYNNNYLSSLRPVQSPFPSPITYQKTVHLQPPIQEKRQLKRTSTKPPIKVVSRNDFVGQFLGQTADKTNKLLTNTLIEGSALFIDEAYSLINDPRDSYGNEALNELNKFMSEHPELIVILAGYKDKIEETIFKQQPGFKRRCTWVFHVDKYTPSMMVEIFKKQLQKGNWIYKGTHTELETFFKENANYFLSFGGDTQRLGLYCKLAYSELRFDQTTGISDKRTVVYKTLDKTILDKAFENYKESYVDKPEEADNAWQTLYT